MDRGFLFGDGVYEVFPVYDNKVIGLEPHLNRLQDGLDAINIENPHSKDEWINLINKIVTLNNKNSSQAIYLQISRGCDENRKHTYGKLKPTIYIQSSGIEPKDKRDLIKGKSAITREDIRWLKSNTKATSLLANTLYAQEAKESDSEEAILYRDGIVTEASSSNVFIVKDSILYTHPKGPNILPGVTRDIAIHCAENLGIKNAKWDAKDGYLVNRDCYNSYFYLVEDNDTNHLDKLIMHGQEMTQYLDGGSALHLNLDESLSADAYVKLFNVAAQTGCNYFCINVKITICNECEKIDKRTLRSCSDCGSENIDHGTRVIGYLKRVTSFSQGRQKEHALRHYHKQEPKQSNNAA